MTSLFLAAALLLAQDKGPQFSDVEIDRPFDTYLKANPLLMDVTGAKVVRLPNGRRVILGVASVAVADGSAEDRKRCERVCRAHAVASILAESQGVQVAHLERLEQVVVIIDDDGKEKATSVSKYLQVTHSKVEGWARDFAVVGRWKSADGTLYYLAIGGILDARGEWVDGEATVRNDPGRGKPMPGGVVSVVATGTGATDAEAVKAALLSAVRQVVGALVDGETLVKNDRLITDKVLTFSDGLVTEYQELETRREGGLVIKKVRARVERGQVISKLRASNIALKDFDGQGAFAKVVTGLEVEKEARQFVRQLVKTYPGNVLTAEVLGDPEVVERSDTEVTLAYKVSITVDPDRYDAFVEKTLAVLKRAAVRTGSCVLRGKPAAADSSLLASFVSGSGRPGAPAVGQTPSVLRTLPRAFYEDWEWWGKGFDPHTDLIFVVNTERNETHDVLVYTWFHVPVVEMPSPELRLTIRLLDRAGKEVKQDAVSLGPNLVGLNTGRRSMPSKKAGTEVTATQVIISPYLVQGLLYSRQVILNRRLKLSLDELRTVSKVRCTIARPG